MTAAPIPHTRQDTRDKDDPNMLAHETLNYLDTLTHPADACDPVHAVVIAELAAVADVDA